MKRIRESAQRAEILDGRLIQSQLHQIVVTSQRRQVSNLRSG